MKNIKKIIIHLILYIITFSIVFSTLLIVPDYKYEFPILHKIIIFFATILLWKYFFYMFLSPWYDLWKNIREKRLKSEIGEYKPKVSVLIPAWNEEVGIIPTIKSLLASTYTNLELVVVNDGSTDDSDCLIRKFVNDYYKDEKNKNIDIIYHYKDNGGKGSALNAALDLSSGEIIVSIDADCLADEEAIVNFVKYFHDSKTMAAVGNVKIGNTKKLIGVIQYLEFLFSFYFKRADSVMNTIYIIGGAAGAFRREVFDKIGKYSTTNITEDIDLSMRMQKAGMKIVYASDAIIHTEGASDMKGLMSQRLRWKRGRFQTFYQHRDLFFGRGKDHSKLLTYLILPLAVFGEIQLFLEVWFLIFLYIYSFLTNDFSSFISGVLMVSSMFLVQIFFDNKRTYMNKLNRFYFYLLSPIAWLLFYISTLVEYSALIRSIWTFLRKKEVVWQKWQRSGAAD